MTAVRYAMLSGDVRDGVVSSGIDVPNMAGNATPCPAGYLALYAGASVGHTVPLALLLVQASQESGFNPNAASFDGGYGIAQFTDPAVAHYYLQVPWDQDWPSAAFNPARAIPAQAWFDRDLYDQAGNSWHGALARYNGGPNGENIPASHAYADGILAHAEAFEGQLVAALAAPIATPAPIPTPPPRPTAPPPTPTPATPAPKPLGYQPRSGPGTMVAADWAKASPVIAGRAERHLPKGTRVLMLRWAAEGDGMAWQRIRAGSLEAWVLARNVARD